MTASSIPTNFFYSTWVSTVTSAIGWSYAILTTAAHIVTLQFEHKVTLGRPPPARGYHISLLADARLFVFGGFDGHVVFDDVWLLDLAGAAYLPQVTSFALLIDGGN
jgi:hypothetical protein